MTRSKSIPDEIKSISFQFARYLTSKRNTITFEDAYDVALLVFNLKGGPIRPGKNLSLGSAKRLNQEGLVVMEKFFSTKIEYEVPVRLQTYYSGTYMRYRIHEELDLSKPGSWWISASAELVTLVDEFLLNLETGNNQ